MPRIDCGSSFGRLLDWKHCGYCSIAPTAAGFSTSRRYINKILVLETRFDTDSNAVRVIDCHTMKRGVRHPHHRLLRTIEGIKGWVDLALCVAGRLDYGQMRPWVRSASLPRLMVSGTSSNAVPPSMAMKYNSCTDWVVNSGLPRLTWIILKLPAVRGRRVLVMRPVVSSSSTSMVSCVN
jgi:hypothetical protein